MYSHMIAIRELAQNPNLELGITEHIIMLLKLSFSLFHGVNEYIKWFKCIWIIWMHFTNSQNPLKFKKYEAECIDDYH